MNNNQRLIPFLGGLVLGGVGGAAFDNRYPNYSYGYNYYPPYYVYNQYPTYYYPAQQPISTPAVAQYNMSFNPYQSDTMTPMKVINENPTSILYSSSERNINSLSHVPIYKKY